MDITRLFFQNQGFFFNFKKGQGWPLLRSHSAPVIMAEYTSISLNIPKYLWKCFNKLFWRFQGSEYTWSSYMFRLLKMPRVLNIPGFLIWHGCICKGYTEFWLCLNIAQYVSLIHEYVSVYLNVPQYVWTWLNISEYMPKNARINFSDYAKVLNLPHHLRYLTGFWIYFRH